MKRSVAEVTIRTHVSNLLRKLHLANRVQATLYALREGLTTLENDQDQIKNNLRRVPLLEETGQD